MANIVKIKQSSVASSAPTTAQLSLGELAVNTTDGKLYLKKSVSSVESIVEVGADKAASAIISSPTGNLVATNVQAALAELEAEKQATSLWVTPAFDANNFTGLGGMTWTVEASDVLCYNYLLVNKTLHVKFMIYLTSVGGTLSDYLKLNLFGFTAASWANAHYSRYQGTTWGAASAEIRAGESAIRLYENMTEGGTWAASTNLTFVKGQLVVEVV